MKYGVKMFTKIEKTNRFQSALNSILAEPKNEGGLKNHKLQNCQRHPMNFFRDIVL